MGSGRAATDRQFFFLNGRPVDLPKFARVLNETYRSLSSPAAASSRPMAIVDLQLPSTRHVLRQSGQSCDMIRFMQWFADMVLRPAQL